jgi:BirA family biotin operon repressor/biotin-[acetyl-CoA-carboxylase] ligase
MLATERLPEGTIIRTDFQSSGRGQPGNSWESEKDKNLLISIILYPLMIRPVEQFRISMMLSLGIHDLLAGKFLNCRIKWPNDIYIKNDKIAGILIENSLRGPHINYSVAGIGLNVNQKVFVSGAPNPVSMKLLSGMDYDLDIVLGELAGSLDKRYEQLRTGEHRQVKNEYLSNLYRYGEWTEFRDSKEKFEARITSVLDDGKLVVEDRKKRKRGYYFKEIDFIL